MVCRGKDALMRKRPVEDRFEAQYTPEPNSGCWLWTGAMGRYPMIWVNEQKRAYGGHRLSYELHRGTIPSGMCVCHRCNNKACVNPGHLYLATTEENSAHAARDGLYRLQPGSINPHSKLVESDIPVIRALVESGMKHRDVARRFGLERRTVGKIVSRALWPHVP